MRSFGCAAPRRLIGTNPLRVAALGSTIAAAVLLLLLMGPFPGQASAATIPIVFPLENRVTVAHDFMTPRVGHLHQGVDLLAPKLTKELACVSGTVTLLQRSYTGGPWYALWLAGDDGRGYYYSHINNDNPGTDDGQGGLQYAFAPGIHTGDHVAQGQFIAYCGDSGNAEESSPHLHFEIHQTTQMTSPPIDPYDSLHQAPLADGTPAQPWPSPILTRYQQTDSHITYWGTWTTFTTSGASGGTYTYADSKAGALIWFVGTRLDLIATKGTTQGKALVSVDGGASAPIDFHSGTTLRQQVAWSTGVLPQGTHTVTLTWTGVKSVAQGGTRVNIDALDVRGTLVNAPRMVTFQQDASDLVYAGTWTVSHVTAASAGSFRFSNSRGSSVTVQFTGLYAALVTKKSPVYGLARLTLDGGAPVLLDLYSASTLYQQKVWNSGLLSYGTHVLTIQWTGTKNRAASGTNVNIDALQVIGDLNALGEIVSFGPEAMTVIP